MRLAVDTNILFSFFWPKSALKGILLHKDMELYSPEYALEEINAHEREILKKSGISPKEFKALREDLAIAVMFVPMEEYAGKLKEATKHSPDPKDADFFAVCLHLDLPLWTNDSTLKRQGRDIMLSTGGLLGKEAVRAHSLP